MLEGYFDLDGLTGKDISIKRKRLLAVQAALEIAKSSAMSADASAHARVDNDMDSTAEKVSLLADAIQAALNK